MNDILEAILKLASPIIAYSRKGDPIVKRIKEHVREEEEKIKREI
jgi:hypothetical protein